MPGEPNVIYEFGPFRLDPEKQVLLRENQPVPVTPKAFETLLTLLRRSREVVSKDDLMKAVWPDAFVEEANLSQNIFMLRKALGDTPEDHRYIVTLPRRGYRFGAPVRTVTEDGEALVVAKRTRAQMIVEETETKPGQAVQALPVGTARRTGWRVVLLVAATAALALAVTPFLLRRRAPTTLGEKDSVLVADFTNNTGDSVFDGTLRQGLQVQLEQSPVLSLVPDDRIQSTLRLMRQSPESRLTGQNAREVCERTASAAVLEGSIASLGGQYVLGLRATNCRTGELLDEQQAQAARKEDILGALSRMVIKFRTRAGESLAAVQQHNTPLEQATTPSLEALKAYSMGWQVRHSTGGDAALPFFKRALEIDPNFAMAHAALALFYGSGGEPTLATYSIRRAYELRERTSERERFFITAYYNGRATGNQEKAQQTCEAWARTYPRETLPHLFLSGFIYPAFGQYGKAAEEGQKVIDLDPDYGLGYGFLGDAYVHLGRLPEADAVLRRASARQMQDEFLLLLAFHLSFLKGDSKGMERVRAQAKGDSGAEDLIAYEYASTLATSGRLREATRMSQHAVDLAKQYSYNERATLFNTRAALWEAFLGNDVAAKRQAVATLKSSHSREAEFGAAFALALAGESSRPEALAQDLDKQFPEDTAVRFHYLPAIRGLIALRKGQPAKAVELTQGAAPYELGSPRSAVQYFFGALYPVYVRGLALMANHQDAEAAAEFQKIVAHREIVFGDPVWLMAQLGLARAYALAGDAGKARSTYEELFSLWNNADSDLPIAKQAKAEYTKLR